MTTQDVLTEIERRAWPSVIVAYDPHVYRFDDALLRQHGAVVKHVPRHKTRDGKTVLYFGPPPVK